MTRMGPKPDEKRQSDSTRIQRELAASELIAKVFCPRVGQAIDVRDCRSCDHGLGLRIDPSDGETVLRCAWPGTSTTERAEAALDEAAPIAIEAEHLTARRTRLSAIMTSPARSVTQDTSIAALVRLFLEEGISAAPVVDSDGKAIGIVSKTDVVRRVFEDDALRAPAGALATRTELASGSRFEIDSEAIARASAREIMTHIVYTLTAEASISRAAALMAYEGVHRIVVAAADGTALGIVSALDILRWMARQDGYIVPDLSRIQTDQRSKRPG